jgi:quinol monooxygenase YgiN
MTTGHLLFLGASVLTCCLCCACGRAPAEPGQDRVVRLAELEIDPAHLDSYKAALKEEIAASIRLEPGVLTLFAVSVKDRPTQIRIFETYADMAAYEAHIRTPHFTKYKTGTQHMVKSLTLVETDPILLGAKTQ